MRDFLPGDRVSFINDKLTGAVKRIIDKKQVLLLLDDGFEIPVSMNELVVIERMGGAEKEVKNDNSIIADEVDKTNKIFFGAITEDTGKGVLVKTYLINTTQSLLKYALFNKTMGIVIGICHGEIEPSRAVNLMEFMLADADDFRNIVLQAIAFSEKPDSWLAPFEIAFKLKPVSLLKDSKIIPVIKQKDCFLILLIIIRLILQMNVCKHLPQIRPQSPNPCLILLTCIWKN